MVPFRVRSYLQIRSLLYWRYLLWRSQYWCPDRIEALQSRLLASLIDYCRAKVPYYRERIAQYPIIRSPDGLTSLPIITKSTLLHQHSSFKSIELHNCVVRKIKTSGTTGTPLEIYWDQPVEIMELVSQWRHFSWLGYRLGQPILDIRSTVIENSRRYIWNWKCRTLEIAVEYIDCSNISEWAGLIRRYRPVLWRGHPFAIDQFCRYLKDAQIFDVRPQYVVTTAEALLDHQKEFIESFAKTVVCENYGLKEHVAMICQCPVGSYHIASEYGIVEIVDENGRPVKPGEEGRIVATGLHNRLFPLIRYDTGDTAVLSNRRCNCGRTLPLVDQITGRLDDYIQDRKGKWHSGFRHGLWNTRGIRRSQLVQKEFGTLDVYLVVSPDFEEGSQEMIIQAYQKHLGDDMLIRVHLVEEVPFLTRSKYKFVIQKMSSCNISKPASG